MSETKTKMTAAVYTNAGVLVNKYELMAQARFAADAKNKLAEELGLSVRYVANALDKVESE